MGELEEIVFGLQRNSEENDEKFRLFLTSAPAPYFPVSTLQGSIKMTNEPPNGICYNVSRAFKALIKEEMWESCAKPLEWKKVVTGLMFFHANLQERRKFGPLGWNIRYAFDESDLETSVAILRRFLDEQDVFPWDALAYVTGMINYGGRVTDAQDRRCLMSILNRHLNPSVLKSDFAFSDSGTYYAPEPGPLESVYAYFASLPTADDPEIFGMHSNADLTYNRNVSTELMALILELQPRTGGGGGAVKGPDEIVVDIATDIQGRVPEIMDIDDAGPTTFVIQDNGLLSSLAIVLQQEIVKFNRLIRKMNSSLVDIKKAIGGLIVMSPDLDAMYGSFLTNKVPGIWDKVSFASLKTLASWVKDVIYRVEFMRNWLLTGLPTTFPLPVFFFPQGFMTGALQTFARKYMQAIDTLNFEDTILEPDPKEITEHPEDGIICYGMYIEGARYCKEKKLLQQSIPGVMFEELPAIHFLPTVCQKPFLMEELSKMPGNPSWTGDKYQMPLYKTAERKGVLSTTGMSTNFVVAVDMPTDVDPGVWVRYGCAGLCNLTD